jgi:hypothetical protein
MKDVSFLADFIGERISQRLDSVVAVDSGAVKGTGKTVFTIDASKELCSRINMQWKMQKFMMMNVTTDKLINFIRDLPFGTPVPVDEAIFIAYKRDYNENPVKKLVKFVNICRKFRKPVFLNSPSFWDLDKDIRNLCDFRATIIKRGIACIRGKYSNPEYEDLWLREESKDIIDKEIGADFTDLNAVIRGVNKCKNHLFDIYFPNLSDDEYNEYEKLSMQQEGKQLMLDEKKVYVIAKLLSYLVLEECYFKNPLGAFTRFNSGILSRMANNYIAGSKYAQEFSKFKADRVLFRDYRRDWRNAMEGGVVGSSQIINNSNIPNSNEIDGKVAAEQLLSQPDDLSEEIA